MGRIAKLPEPLHLAVARADELAKLGESSAAVDVYQQIVHVIEPTPAELCIKLGGCYERLGDFSEARRWAAAVVDSSDDFGSWQRALGLVERCDRQDVPQGKRHARVALLGSYTTTQFGQLLRLACRRLGIVIDLYEGYYGQYRQEILNPDSPTYAFSPHVVILAVHEGELRLPEFSATPEEDVEREAGRWVELWQTLASHSKSRMVQFNFAIPCETPFGHLGSRLPGSRYMMTNAVNARLGSLATDSVSVLDCERISSLFGKQQWFDPRYWYLSKQAVSLQALPLLARHAAAVLAAELGLSRKCLVLDLDNTLWGGVIGEDGLTGIRIGHGVDGEAYVTLQEFILKLKRKGVILAVCSKNNEMDAKEPFLKHPEMRIGLDDIALFLANWRPKPENLRIIAETLNIGPESLVFLDDSPVERAVVLQALPEVDVIHLPPDPSQYTRVLSQYLGFETSAYTGEDANRTNQYQAKARIAELAGFAQSLDEFHRNLQMEAVIAPFDEMHLPRIAQLIAKTNQFNLTTKRHGLPELRALTRNPDCVHFYVRLKDHFADHGLIGVVIAMRQDNELEIDSLLMSCRVIGRTVEAAMLQHLCREACRLGCQWIAGTYIPTAKNDLVRDLLPRFGFSQINSEDGTLKWRYDLRSHGPILNEFVTISESAGTLV